MNIFSKEVAELIKVKKSHSSWGIAKTFLQHYKKELACYEGTDFNKIMKYRIIIYLWYFCV